MAPADTKAKIGVLGASGYTGSELVRLLLRHPRAEIALLTADRRAGQEMAAVFPQFSPYALPKLVSIDGIDWAGAGLDLAFCALPHGTTQKVIKDCSRRRRRPRWSISRPTSGLTTRQPMRAGTAMRTRRRSCRGEAVYGLTEIYRDEIRQGAARRQSRLLHDLRAACR